ncbi:MAG TPA: hypothetical protein VGX52_01860 [Burkholderiales bacterium]|nr:hypothetical protein [Burkholderiales bacterium]
MCIAPGTLLLPTGRIEVTPGSLFRRGEKYMGVDLAALLDEQYAKDQH